MSAFLRKGHLLCAAWPVLERQTSGCSSTRNTRSEANRKVRRLGPGLRDSRTMSVFKHGQRPSTHMLCQQGSTVPRTVIEYKCLLISPGDVQDERAALTDTVAQWNAQIGNALGAKVELVKWETHSAPEMSGEPQTVLNQQIVDHCDFGVAVFWYRLGTPTNNYASGSIEEINRIGESGKRLLVYFCSRAIPQDALTTDQYQKLQETKKELQQKGLLGTYSDTSNLQQQFQLHLTKVITDLLAKDRTEISQFQNLQPTTLSKPDVRVKVNGAFVTGYEGVEDIVSVDVQNHSPMTVFLGNVVLRLKGGNVLFPAADAVTKEFQRRRELMPGQKFSFHISPKVIFEHTDINNILCAAVSDDIERTYESDGEALRMILQSMINKHHSHNNPINADP